jgi:hypothetical protein
MLLLGVVAIGLAYLFGRSLSVLHVDPPWWLDTPAVLGFYGLCWRLYDEHLWRLGPVTRTVSGVPNVSGHWIGAVWSSHSKQNPIKASLDVRQTSSRLLVTLETDTSRSHSTMAALCSAPGPGNGLRYAFANVPRTLTEETMRPHTGVAHLTLSADGSELAGDYETDRFRNTSGQLKFRRTAAVGSTDEPTEDSRGYTR